MIVTYNAPNRAHHYAYARELAVRGVLGRFVSGFSRFSRFSPMPELGDLLLRADHLQNLYLASLRFSMPALVSDELAFLSKQWLDRASEAPARKSDVFVFYNGAGLTTAQKLRGSGTVRIVEVVNTHVQVQEQILHEEHKLLGLPFRPFHQREVARRVAEYEEADFVLGPSAFVRKSFIERGLPKERFLLNPYGFELPESVSPESSRRDRETFRVLYVGQVALRKGLRYLIKAFERLRHPKKELWIVGPRVAETGIEDLVLPPEVYFTGVLKGEVLRAAYRDASVFVLPSLEDGFGLVLGEALAAGLPIIATENTGAADLFEDDSRVSGWTVPIRDVIAISERLQMLADDPVLRSEMSQNAIERSRSLNGWESSGRELVSQLKAALSSRQLL